jgi:serine phosphatase RsbU (regulator of sigma subunit)/integral membrane sensor domain MASE1
VLDDGAGRDGARTSRLRHDGFLDWAGDRRPPETVVGVALLYAACSHLAFWWFDANGIGPTFFPAAGLTLGLLVLLPRRNWPWVLLGAAIAELTLDLIHDLTLAQALGFVLANTAEPLAGAASIRAAAGDVPEIRRRRGLMIFVVFGVLVAPVVGGAIGATTDELFGTGGRWLSFAAHWWIGDGLGILVVGGAIVSWALPRTSGPRERGRRSETSVLAVMAVCLVVIAVQTRWLLAAYLIAILVGVAAFRLGTNGVTFVGAALAFSVATAAANGYDFFGGLSDPTGSSVISLQSTVLLLLAGALILATEIFERDAATQRWALERAYRENAEVDAARERAVALTLQRSMLGPERFETDDISVSCLYRAGASYMTAGGDWHDVIELPGGMIGLTVGDVVGHGIEAASVMAQLRVALAAIAADEPRPGAVIERLETFASRIEGAEAATLVYATLDPASGSLSYTCAGHPPPVLIAVDGTATLEWDGRSPPLGVASDAPRSEGSAVLDPGATLILYTDGLVERREEPLDAGLERLRALVGSSELTSADRLERIVTAMSETGGSFVDDVVLLAVRRRGLPLQDTPSVPMREGAHE